MQTGLAWIAVMMWMAGILYTSSLGQAVTPVAGHIQTIVAKTGHITEYAILGALLWLSVRGEGPSTLRLRWVFASVLIIGAIFASFDELRQSFVPGREPRVSDVLLDSASVVLGALAISRLLRVKAKKKAAPTGAAQ